MPEVDVDVDVETGNAQTTPVGLEKTVSNATNRKKPIPEIPRLVLRDLPAFQSRNRFFVKQKLTRELWWLLRHDWFHVILNRPAPVAVFILLIIWTLMILLFAVIYIRLDKNSSEEFCGLGQENDPILFGAAFAFSLETCTTVGKFPCNRVFPILEHFFKKNLT